MKVVISFIIEYIIAYIAVFILNYLIFVRKKTTYNKNKVPVEYYYLVSLYKLDEKKIDYKKFIYQTAFINTFIIVTTYMIINRLLNKWIWQLIVGIAIIILLIIICYGILGRYYQKHNKLVTAKKRGKKNV